MKKHERTFISLLAFFALFGAWLDHTRLPSAQERLERLPASGTGFTTQPLPVSSAERAVFGDALIFRRLVVLDSQQFVLTVIDGTANRHALHDPLYCIRGAGYDISRRETASLPGGSFERLRLQRKANQREFLYYFSNGSTRYVSPLRCWGESIARRLTLGHSGPAPVLVEIEPREKSLDLNKIFLRIPELQAL